MRELRLAERKASEGSTHLEALMPYSVSALDKSSIVNTVRDLSTRPRPAPPPGGPAAAFASALAPRPLPVPAAASVRVREYWYVSAATSEMNF